MFQRISDKYKKDIEIENLGKFHSNENNLFFILEQKKR